MHELYLIAKNARTSIVVGEMVTGFDDVSVTAITLEDGDIAINVRFDNDGLLVLVLDKNAAASLLSVIGKLVLKGEVIQ